MSVRHIVRVSPIHTSILLTLVYCSVAIMIGLVGLVSGALMLREGELIHFLQSATSDLLWAVVLNIVLVFFVSLLVSVVYNFLAKYLGGVEITLDDD